MKLIEKIKSANQNNEIVPLKGHIKLILEDVRDGTQKVEEVDNLMTNAVASIFERNYCGLADFNQLLPLRSLYGGVCCFQNVQTENADNYYPPNDLVNPLIAHAGDIANNTGSLLRGSPVSNDFIITDTSIKQVWLWDNTQGNGHIESVSLVPAKLGNMGLKPYDTEFNPLSTFGNDQLSTNITAWSVDIAKQYPFSISNDGKTSRTVWLDNDTFTEYTVRHDYSAFGIMRGSRDWQDIQNRTATVRTPDNRFVFDDEDYYYVASAYYNDQSEKYGLYIDKISKSTFAVTQADCEFPTVTLWIGSITVMSGALRPFAYDGTYLYFPNRLGTSFVKLNLSDSSDVLTLDGTITINKGYVSTNAYNGEQFASPLVINDGLILGDNYIINGNVAYQIAQTKRIGCHAEIRSQQNWLWLVQHGAAVYGNGKQRSDSTSRWTGQSNVLCQMFLSTIANLPTARDKSTSQTMRIEYTSTEIT